MKTETKKTGSKKTQDEIDKEVRETNEILRQIELLMRDTIKGKMNVSKSIINFDTRIEMSMKFKCISKGMIDQLSAIVGYTGYYILGINDDCIVLNYIHYIFYEHI